MENRRDLLRLVEAQHKSKWGDLDPTRTSDMIVELQRRFKDRIPRKSVTHDEVMKMQGQQQVIDYMLGTLQELERKQELHAHVRK